MDDFSGLNIRVGSLVRIKHQALPQSRYRGLWMVTSIENYEKRTDMTTTPLVIARCCKVDEFGERMVLPGDTAQRIGDIRVSVESLDPEDIST
jgi:hypothetical protein